MNTKTRINRNSSTLRLQIAGVLFLLVFGLYGGGSALAANDLDSFGLVLMLANSVAVIIIGVIIIGVILWPVIAADAPLTAIVYMASRLIEGSLLGVGAIVLILADNAELNLSLYRLGMITLGLGSIGFCRWLLWSRRIYALHAWLGLIGYPLLALAMVAGFVGMDFWSYTLLLPGAAFELTFGLYLLFVGLRPNTS